MAYHKKYRDFPDFLVTIFPEMKYVIRMIYDVYMYMYSLQKIKILVRDMLNNFTCVIVNYL